MGIPDLIIAVTAIANDVEVFSKDHHFDLMEKILDLEMFTHMMRITILIILLTIIPMN